MMWSKATFGPRRHECVCVWLSKTTTTTTTHPVHGDLNCSYFFFLQNFKRLFRQKKCFATIFVCFPNKEKKQNKRLLRATRLEAKHKDSTYDAGNNHI